MMQPLALPLSLPLLNFCEEGYAQLSTYILTFKSTDFQKICQFIQKIGDVNPNVAGRREQAIFFEKQGVYVFA
jgi:hypothetical protein